jgi:acetylornithine/succinyldiaminopimelate/putrescine aminotransferase
LADARDRYERKGVPEGKAIVFSAANNFHGRTLGVIRCVHSMSCDPVVACYSDPLLVV